MADFDPTAANIIASLGIKGAATSGNHPGYVPVIGANGKLSADFIPSDAAQLAIPSLSNVAYVDPYTEVPYAIRKGSIVAPYKSISEAASRFFSSAYGSSSSSSSYGRSEARSARYVAFVLSPGKYSDSSILFPESFSPLSVYLIGTGECSFAPNTNNVVIGGIGTTENGRRPSVLFQNVVMNGTVTVQQNADITILGRTYFGTLNAQSGSTLRLVSESYVGSTNIQTITYLSEDIRIKNTTNIAGATVGAALGRVGRRKVRIANVGFDSSGFDVDSSCSYVDVYAESSSSFDFFDLRDRDRILIQGINTLFNRGKHIVADTVTANTITASVAEINELRMSALKLGGYKLTIDAYGYLVVADGSANPPRPPENVILLRDSVTNKIYMLGVASGRMYVADAEIDSSSESSGSSSSGIEEQINVYDPVSGYTYAVSMSNGRLIITRIGG